MEISPPPLTEAEQLSNFAYSTSSGEVVKRDFTKSVKSDNRYGSNWVGVNMMKLKISVATLHMTMCEFMFWTLNQLANCCAGIIDQDL